MVEPGTPAGLQGRAAKKRPEAAFHLFSSMVTSDKTVSNAGGWQSIGLRERPVGWTSQFCLRVKSRLQPDVPVVQLVENGGTPAFDGRLDEVDVGVEI